MLFFSGAFELNEYLNQQGINKFFFATFYLHEAVQNNRKKIPKN